MGLPPDRAPEEQDWAWLNALSGNPEPGTEKGVLRETALLADALREVFHDRSPPPMDVADEGSWDERDYELSDDYELDASDDKLKGVMASIDIMASYERPPPPESTVLYPEPSGNGFNRLKMRLRAAGLL